MTDKEIMQDINYRIRKSDIIKKLEEDVAEGIYDDNPLIDLVLYYKRDIEQLKEENESLYEDLDREYKDHTNENDFKKLMISKANESKDKFKNELLNMLKDNK